MSDERAPLSEEMSALRTILATAAGRRVLWSVIEQCGVYAISFRGDGELWTVYRDGRRSIGLDLIGEIDAASPGTFPLMGREDADRKSLAKLEAEKRLAEQEANDEG